jgi:DNA repair protein RecN (Recombination protein N)
MLRELHIRDLALIAEARLTMHEGFVVWSGETGAGKSLLISAIALLTGAKADAGMVRDGASEAVIRGEFDLTRPDVREAVENVLGETVEGDSLIVTRRIQAGVGRTSATVNGDPAAQKTLQALGRTLVHHVGQHQTRSLSESAVQTAMIDKFGGVEADLRRFLVARGRYEKLRRARAAAAAASLEEERERERLRYELEELNKLAPEADEPAALMAEARRLARADEIRRLTALAHGALVDQDGAVYEQVARIVKKLAPIANLSPPLTEAHEGLTRLLEQLDEIAGILSTEGESAEADPNRSDAIERRLAEYRRLAKRFAVQESQLPAIRDSHRARLAELERSFQERFDEQELREAWDEAHQAAAAVQSKRADAASRLAAEINARLKRLGMESAEILMSACVPSWPTFMAELPVCPENPAPMSVLFRPNPGEPPRPMDRIASGGELSRLLLATLACLADSDRIPTVILDEIDSGVGGRLGAEIGAAIAELARHHQVFCITHLPQIAAQAQQHYLVRKRQETDRTFTVVEELSCHERRVDELAAMLRGKKADANTRIEAQAMLPERVRKPSAKSPQDKGTAEFDSPDRTTNSPRKTRRAASTEAG